MLGKISKSEIVHGGSIGRNSSKKPVIDDRVRQMASRFFGLENFSGFKVRQGTNSTRLVSPDGIGYLFITPSNTKSRVDYIERYRELHELAGYDVGSIHRSGFSAVCFVYIPGRNSNGSS